MKSYSDYEDSLYSYDSSDDELKGDLFYEDSSSESDSEDDEGDDSDLSEQNHLYNTNAQENRYISIFIAKNATQQSTR